MADLLQECGAKNWNDPNMLNLYSASDVTPSLSLGAKAPIEGKKEESTCTHSCSQGNSGSPQMAFFRPLCPDFSTRFGLNSTPIWGGPLLSAIWIRGQFEGEFWGRRQEAWLGRWLLSKQRGGNRGQANLTSTSQLESSSANKRSPEAARIAASRTFWPSWWWQSWLITWWIQWW